MAQLQDLFRTHAIVKILDFLTLYSQYEYTKTDIAREIGISRRTLYEVWPILERFDLVRVTKSYGMIKFFSLNTENLISKNLIALADEISFYEAYKTSGLEPMKTPQVSMTTSQSSSINQDFVEIAGEVIQSKKSITIKGTPSQIKKLLRLNLSDTEASFHVTDSTGNESIELKKTSILRTQFKDGKPIKLVIKD